MVSNKLKASLAIKDALKPLGIVFGDIGTSPIYTLTAIFLIYPPTSTNIFGVISLIIWSLIIIVYLQYTWLAMNLSLRGEGGTIILREIFISLLKNKKHIRIVVFLSFIAISFIIGDGVITPAITILSAVEGLVLIPGLESLPLYFIVSLAAVITFLLFVFQRRGTDNVSKLFSPLMLIWFLSLALSGILSLLRAPGILSAISPHYAVEFFIHHKALGLLVFSEVILAVTGGEALYADMGHLGKESIRRAWHFVFICLVLNYMGQGAHMMLHPDTKSTLFGMIYSLSKAVYIPFLLLTVMATVIASQSMISAMFSIVYQGINTHIMPRLKVTHTSKKMSSQIYISFVNWSLFICVLMMLFIFQKSSHMAVAYGFAINITMTMEALMLFFIYSLKKERLLAFFSGFVILFDLVFLYANLHKIPQGGYISLVIAAIPLSVIILFKLGQERLYRTLRPMPAQEFMTRYESLYHSGSKINGTAIFLLRDAKNISPYMANVIFQHRILYEYNVILSISPKEKPFGIKSHFLENLGTGLRVFEIRMGYMEMVNIEEILCEHGIDEKVIFYGIEDVVTENPVWKAFAAMKALSPAIVQFYNFPPQKILGVITQVKL
jgi:KUP system potassium uptake protein